MSAKDISRFLFQPQKRYSGVRMQQGRVMLDSDWNESEGIDDEEARRILVETVCTNGTPGEGFLVQDVTAATVTKPPSPGEELPSSKETYDFALASGSYYLGGLRFEAITEVVAHGPDITERFLGQNDWLQIDADLGNLPARPSAADLTNADGSFKVRVDLVYLRGWEQCVTATEDSELRERALGGPDTSVRMRRMRRVEVLPDVLDPTVARDTCSGAFDALKLQLAGDPRQDAESQFFDEANFELRSKAKLTISFGAEGIIEDPCKPKVTAGFLGAENQTIRVQLTATDRFIWGYDNASPLYRVQVLEEGGQPVKIKFLTLPRDQDAQPLKGQAVEILPWGAFLPNQEKIAELQGHLATVATSFDAEENTITLSQPVPQAWIDWLNAPEHVKYLSDRDSDDKKKYVYLRLWTGGSGDADQPDWTFAPGAPAELSGTGLSVSFSQHGLPGDFWIIAARPNTPDLVVPWDLLQEALPAGPRLFFAPLALISWHVGRDTVEATVEDCRHKFRTLCEAVAREPGIHIVDLKLMSGEPLRNDANVPVNAFAQGIQVLCDEIPDQNTIRGKPTCSVTLELPFPFNDSDRRLWGADAVIGFQPLILAANSNADGKTIFWMPAAGTQRWLVEKLFGNMIEFSRGSRVLAHLMLKGNFVWSRDNPQLYLDGETFGFFQPGPILQPGQATIDVDLRNGSGNGLRGGDFEMWFWLVAQPPAAKVISIDPPGASRFFLTDGGGGNAPSRIMVTFDKNLRADTVNERTIQVMMFPDNALPNALVAGTVTYDDTTKSAQFKPSQPFLAGVTTNGFRYELTVHGTGQNPILDADGLALDGNGDGIPGGNKVSQFNIFFVIG